MRFTSKKFVNYYTKKQLKDKEKCIETIVSIYVNFYSKVYSYSSASSTASSMNSFTNLRVRISMAIPRKSDVNAEITGEFGKRKLSASAQIPRQKRIMAAPTKNASMRLFQSSPTVGLCLKSLWRIIGSSYHISRKIAKNSHVSSLHWGATRCSPFYFLLHLVYLGEWVDYCEFIFIIWARSSCLGCRSIRAHPLCTC